MKRVAKTRQTSNQTYKRGNGILLDLTYHLRLKNINHIITKHLIFLYAKEQVENIFTPPPFFSICTGFSLRKHLIRSKVCPLSRECRSSGCNKSKCQTSLNVNSTDAFQGFVTKETYKIKQRLDCDSKCIIYLFSCKTCGVQYVGSIVGKGSTTGYTTT